MKKIILSRTDSIGDVVLTIPLAGILKKFFPGVKIIFIGKKYTKPVLELSKFIDEIWDWSELEKEADVQLVDHFKVQNADCILHVFPNRRIANLARLAKIPQRIGTSHRFYHWWTCNKRISFTRKGSDLHEAQLNTKLLEPLIGERYFSTYELVKYYGFTNFKAYDASELLAKDKFNLILHPKSQGSAVEWGVANFSELIEGLPQEKFKIFISGTDKEKVSFQQELLEKYANIVTDVTGKFSLDEFISFINQADGLIAASTGPLHIAAASGKYALGLYSNQRPIFPKRWKPLGHKASVLINENYEGKDPLEEIKSITAQRVAERVLEWVNKSP